MSNPNHKNVHVHAVVRVDPAQAVVATKTLTDAALIAGLYFTHPKLHLLRPFPQAGSQYCCRSKSTHI